MKKIILVIVLVASAAAYIWFNYRPKTDAAVRVPRPDKSSIAAPAEARPAPDGIHTTDDFRKKYKELTGSDMTTEKDGASRNEEPEVLVFHLKHGSVISGKILEKTPQSYTVEWKGAPYVISVSQIGRIESKSQSEPMWQYKNYVVVKKTNGLIIDGKIVGVDEGSVVVSFDEGGGAMEMGIGRKEIDRLVFAPVWNKETAAAEERLKKVFPKMRVYSEGNITVFTDSSESGIKSFLKSVNDIYTEDYLRFFKLFEGRRPLAQNFIVFFEDAKDYYKNMYADMGMVSLSIAGYFSPLDQTLYIFNAWGKDTEKLYFDWISDLSKKFEDSGIAAKSKYKDSSAEIQIDGIVKAYKNAIWDWYYFHKNYYTSLTALVMRHEFTHEIFHSWGLQTVVMGKPDVDKNKMAEKKKEILDTLESNDREKREKLFVELMRLQKEESEGLDIGISNSWLVEGIALYCDTTPIGAIDKERLYDFQEMGRKGKVNPLEFFTNFKTGSFSGLQGEAVLEAYAQSWAFTSFLMNRYEGAFMEYQRLIAEKVKLRPGDKLAEDDFALLLKCLGKDLPTLEKEFTEYMKTYKTADDPSLETVVKYQELKDEFERIHQFGA